MGKNLIFFFSIFPKLIFILTDKIRKIIKIKRSNKQIQKDLSLFKDDSDEEAETETS